MAHETLFLVLFALWFHHHPYTSFLNIFNLVL